MLFGVLRGTNKEILDVVIRTPEAEIRVRREERLIPRLRQLPNYVIL